MIEFFIGIFVGTLCGFILAILLVAGDDDK